VTGNALVCSSRKIVKELKESELLSNSFQLGDLFNEENPRPSGAWTGHPQGQMNAPPCCLLSD
jgi:hypothetical protein